MLCLLPRQRHRLLRVDGDGQIAVCLWPCPPENDRAVAPDEVAEHIPVVVLNGRALGLRAIDRRVILVVERAFGNGGLRRKPSAAVIGRLDGLSHITLERVEVRELHALGEQPRVAEADERASSKGAQRQRRAERERRSTQEPVVFALRLRFLLRREESLFHQPPLDKPHSKYACDKSGKQKQRCLPKIK